MFKTGKQLLAVTVLTASLCASVQAVPEPDDHSHHAAESAQLTLNHGRKWLTDDNLRQGMAHIRDALAADWQAIQGGNESAEQYQTLAKKVDDEVESIVRSCTLDDDADEMLHIVLSKIIAGSHGMVEQKSKEGRLEGVGKIARALEDYGTYFDHLGWRSLKQVAR